MQFNVRAHDLEANQLVSLRVDALDEADALSQVRARKLSPLELQPRRDWFSGRKKRTIAVD